MILGYFIGFISTLIISTFIIIMLDDEIEDFQDFLDVLIDKPFYKYALLLWFISVPLCVIILILIAFLYLIFICVVYLRNKFKKPL